MSHGGGLVPYISSYTSALSEAGAGKVLSISGFGLSLGTRVELSTLGTETGRSFSKTSATEGTLSITLTVATLPGSPAAVAVKIRSDGGQVAQGPDVSASGEISVYHGWTPIVLCTGEKDYWWNPDSLSLTDGDAVASFTDSANSLTMTEPSGSTQPAFKDSTYLWSGTGTEEDPHKRAAAIYSDSNGQMKGQDIPLTETGGVITGFTVAFIGKSPTVNNSHFSFVVGQGGSDISHRYMTVVRQDLARTWVAGTDTIQNFSSNWDGSIITPILTGSGGSASLTIPEKSYSQSISYTEKNNATDTGQIYTSYTEAYFGETLILSRELTASEITQLRAYWANKYGS